MRQMAVFDRIVKATFLFEEKTAYEVRISDWSSDGCSSDLAAVAQRLQVPQPAFYASCVGRRGGTAHDVGVGTQPLGHSLPQFGEAWRISADGPARPQQADENQQHQRRGKADQRVIDRKSTRLNSSH